MARINLKKFVAEHYKGGVAALDVIREGVTNSIQAGADAITVVEKLAKRFGVRAGTLLD